MLSRAGDTDSPVLTCAHLVGLGCVPGSGLLCSAMTEHSGYFQNQGSWYLRDFKVHKQGASNGSQMVTVLDLGDVWKGFLPPEVHQYPQLVEVASCWQSRTHTKDAASRHMLVLECDLSSRVPTPGHSQVSGSVALHVHLKYSKLRGVKWSFHCSEMFSAE